MLNYVKMFVFFSEFTKPGLFQARIFFMKYVFIFFVPKQFVFVFLFGPLQRPLPGSLGGYLLRPRSVLCEPWQAQESTFRGRVMLTVAYSEGKFS